MLEDPKRFGPIDGPSAWYGPDMAARPDEWLYQLDTAEVAEIDDAVALLTQGGTPVIEVTRENFPLPNLGRVLDGIQNDVVNGRGFTLIRGIPVATYTIEEAALAYFGIGAYFGWAIPQNAQGHVLGQGSKSHFREPGAGALVWYRAYGDD